MAVRPGLQAALHQASVVMWDGPAAGPVSASSPTAALQAVRFQVQEEPGRLDTERGFIAPLEKQGSVIMNPVRQKRNRFRLGLGRSSGFADLRSEGGHV